MWVFSCYIGGFLHLDLPSRLTKLVGGNGIKKNFHVYVIKKKILAESTRNGGRKFLHWHLWCNWCREDNFSNLIRKSFRFGQTLLISHLQVFLSITRKSLKMPILKVSP